VWPMRVFRIEQIASELRVLDKSILGIRQLHTILNTRVRDLRLPFHGEAGGEELILDIISMSVCSGASNHPQIRTSNSLGILPSASSKSQELFPDPQPARLTILWVSRPEGKLQRLPLEKAVKLPFPISKKMTIDFKRSYWDPPKVWKSTLPFLL
jgi:hypothetical protein